MIGPAAPPVLPLVLATRRLVVVIPGDPVAQGRPRAYRMGAGIRVVDPEKSRSWKGVAQVHYLAALTGLARPYFPTGPLRFTVEAYFKRPHFPKRVPPWRQPKTSRPDCSNICKAAEDAANGLLWTDDSQIVELVVRKWVHADGEGPRVEIVVEEIQQ